MKKTIAHTIWKCFAAMSMLLWISAPHCQAQFSKPGRAYVGWLVKSNSPTRTYQVNQPAIISVDAQKAGLPIDGITLHYQTGTDGYADGKKESGEVTFVNGTATLPPYTLSTPGFRTYDLQFAVSGKTYKEKITIGFSPDSIRTLTPLPHDFDRFWKRQVAKVAKINMQPQLTPLPQYTTDKVAVYLLKLQVGANRHFYGYLTMPRDGKKHPVLFCPPGAGSKKISHTTYYSERGYIYLNINIHNGCNPELPDSLYQQYSNAVNNYNRCGIEDKESFYYREVYAGCTRCIDYLCSLPNWDGLNVGVTGGSQGGALSIVTAALSNKVTFCVPFYPALSDVLGFCHQRCGGWPQYYQKQAEAEGTMNTLPYYDVVNFASRITCPVYFSLGYNDNVTSPTSTYAAYNAINSPKTLNATSTSGHWRFVETNEEAMQWMQQQWK